MSAPKRKREVQLNFRVSPEELALIEQKMAQLGTTNREAYLRKMALDGYVVRLELPEGWKAHALYHHSEDDALYLSVETADGCGIWKFEGGDSPLPYRWRSKEFFTSALYGMTAARVQGEQGARNPVRMDIFGPDGERPRATLRLTNGKTVRIRPTRAERLWSFELSGTADVYEARLGGNVEGVENDVQ